MMKKFTCSCIDEQFKNPEQVYLGIDGNPIAEILCVYKPKESVTLRRVKLEAKFCPLCGRALQDL